MLTVGVDYGDYVEVKVVQNSQRLIVARFVAVDELQREILNGLSRRSQPSLS